MKAKPLTTEEQDKQAIKLAEDRCYNEDHHGLDDDEVDEICWALWRSERSKVSSPPSQDIVEACREWLGSTASQSANEPNSWPTDPVALAQFVSSREREAVGRATAEERRLLVDTLAQLYGSDPVNVGACCDEVIDRSGRLLGVVREKAASIKSRETK